MRTGKALGERLGGREELYITRGRGLGTFRASRVDTDARLCQSCRARRWGAHEGGDCELRPEIDSPDEPVCRLSVGISRGGCRSQVAESQITRCFCRQRPVSILENCSTQNFSSWRVSVCRSNLSLQSPYTASLGLSLGLFRRGI